MYIPQKNNISIAIKGNNISVSYGLQWLYSVMTVSARSMVPFKFFTVPAKLTNRSYPRSENPGFFLHKDDKLNTSPSAGGRKHVDYAHQVPELCKLFGNNADLKIPFSDIAIASKRAVCILSIKAFKGSAHFKVLGGLPNPLPDKLYPDWPVHGYPLLCIIGKTEGGAFSHDKINTQGEWRVVQCVFGAVLTGLLRSQFLAIEVVSREGFGSVFPTLADLPDGIRLDPGLLPPEAGALAIAEALVFLDGFISAMQKIGSPKCAVNMNGFDAEPLNALDNLMSELLNFALTNAKAGPDAYADLVTKHRGKETLCQLEYLDGDIQYQISDAFPLIKQAKFSKIKRRAPLKEDSGYGSESDYEEDDEPEETETPQLDKTENPALQKFKSKTDKGEKEISTYEDFAIKKISVLSGMAALRMATLYGMYYSKWLFTTGPFKNTEASLTSNVKTWAPYFELDHDFGNLWKKVESSPNGIHMLIFDGAPNPINIPDVSDKSGPVSKKPSKAKQHNPILLDVPKNLGAIIIDTTNLMSWEKAQYLAIFQTYLAQPQGLDQPGGVLIMIDSASKHPTGGDLVHGVMRVCGHKTSVEMFFNLFLFPHFLPKFSKHLNFTEEFNTKTLTVLSEDETEARRMMKDYRIVMRNSDFWQWFGKF
ncbi:MAG: hypothetical protein WC782_16025 [Methylococcaceae bacterium]|jgi:hypothetical protein